MAGKFLNKTSFLKFCKRLTTSEFQHFLSFSKQNGETSQSIQKMSYFWQQFGWSDYYRQLQSKVERLVDNIERRFQAIGYKMPSTENRSIRQAKQNVRQLVIDSKQRLAKDIVLMRDILPSRRVTKKQNIDSMSMMEEGKLERINEAGISIALQQAANMSKKCHSEDGSILESGNGENMPSSIEAACGNVYSSTNEQMDEHEISPSDSTVVDARMSLSTTGGVFPQTVLSSAVNSN